MQCKNSTKVVWNCTIIQIQNSYCFLLSIKSARAPNFCDVNFGRVFCEGVNLCNYGKRVNRKAMYLYCGICHQNASWMDGACFIFMKHRRAKIKLSKAQ